MDTTQDNPMTADKVDVGALEALMAKATPGEWYAGDGGLIWRRPQSDLYQFGGTVAGDKPLACVNPGWHEEGQTPYPRDANAALIVAAVNALPELLRIYRAWQGAAVGTVVAGRANSYGGYHVEVAHEQGWASGTRVRLVPDGDAA